MNFSESEEKLRKIIDSVVNGGMPQMNALNLQNASADASILIGQSLLNNNPNLLEQGGLVQNLDLFSSSFSDFRNINQSSNNLQRLPFISNPFSLDKELMIQVRICFLMKYD